MSKLFSPLKLRSIELKNRIFVSPMCQYSSASSFPEDWHFVHLGSRAAGGAEQIVSTGQAVAILLAREFLSLAKSSILTRKLLGGIPSAGWQERKAGRSSL